MEALILAGGKAERLGAAAGGKPKALVPIAGRPLAAYQLARDQGRLGVRVELMTAGEVLHPLGAHPDDDLVAGLDLGISTGAPNTRIESAPQQQRAIRSRSSGSKGSGRSMRRFCRSGKASATRAARSRGRLCR